jgi:hypothetical protein
MYRVGAVKSSRLKAKFIHWQVHLKRDIPLSHPKVLRYIFEYFSTFLISNGFVDMVKKFFSHITSRLNSFIFLSDFGILQDLININGQFSPYIYTRQRILHTCFMSRGYLVILCTRSRNTIKLRWLNEYSNTYLEQVNS